MANTVVLGAYTITFLGATCQNNQQTWRYSVALTGDSQGREISNWALELCPSPEHIVLSCSPQPCETNVPPGPAQPCLVNIGVQKQIKWEGLNNINIVGQIFQFTLQGCFQETEVDVALAGGGTCFFGTIIGPSCEGIIPPPPPPPPRGVIL